MALNKLAQPRAALLRGARRQLAVEAPERQSKDVGHRKMEVPRGGAAPAVHGDGIVLDNIEEVEIGEQDSVRPCDEHTLVPNPLPLLDLLHHVHSLLDGVGPHHVLHVGEVPAELALECLQQLPGGSDTLHLGHTAHVREGHLDLPFHSTGQTMDNHVRAPVWVQNVAVGGPKHVLHERPTRDPHRHERPWRLALPGVLGREPVEIACNEDDIPRLVSGRARQPVDGVGLRRGVRVVGAMQHERNHGGARELCEACPQAVAAVAAAARALHVLPREPLEDVRDGIAQQLLVEGEHHLVPLHTGPVHQRAREDHIVAGDKDGIVGYMFVFVALRNKLEGLLVHGAGPPLA
mmetsp:Transcript_38974/g.121442  ORF Transcript_38974/g.121442 Transcript_38974/m.121442 type:complete len:349 (+) Transcript_38974:250-1296(+)